MVRNKMVLNCDDDAPCNISLRMKPTSGDDAVAVASLYPDWSDLDDNILDGVYELCALEACLESPLLKSISDLGANPTSVANATFVENVLSALPQHSFEKLVTTYHAAAPTTLVDIASDIPPPILIMPIHVVATLLSDAHGFSLGPPTLYTVPMSLDLGTIGEKEADTGDRPSSPPIWKDAPEF